MQLINPSTSSNELNTTLTPHSITHGDACFAYFNKIWGIPYGTGSYYSGYSSPAYSAPSSYGYSGYGYPSYSAPYYGSGYGPYYGGYGFSTAPLYKPVTFRLPGWRY